MGSEYDRKFEEMKKYIPFLESMITRLESNSSSASNPRQAQLDKIRSLRDLLLDQKKRMKMDNLLKCEQVLVNLYAKVEQKDAIPVVKQEKMEPRSSNDKDLEIVRNKLKTVGKMHNTSETLPEIERVSENFEIAVRSELEEVCEPGSKEPALFQRRPNRSSISPLHSPRKSHDSKSISMSQSKRYTRVLLSPEPRSSRWPDEGTSSDKLYSRRSPKRSPKKLSPNYHKKERRKSSKPKEKSRKDLNITLKVPEESLHSLNTEDILSRIITCSDGDVDIATLRELRSQILGELKQTGSNEDISDLILKSYNKKRNPTKKKSFEVEEGEISDSESEAIENIYGSLVVKDKDKKLGQAKTSSEKTNQQQRKIQICLVINADKESKNPPTTEIDLAESGAFDSKVICVDSDTSPSPTKIITKNDTPIIINDVPNKVVTSEEQAITTETIEIQSFVPILDLGKNKDASTQPTVSDNISAKQSTESTASTSTTSTYNEISPNKSELTSTKTDDSPSYHVNTTSPNKETDKKQSENTKNIANFYNAQPEDVDKSQPGVASNNSSDEKLDSAIENVTQTDNLSESKPKDSTEIPLLNEPTLPPKAVKDVISEIDILQALKNEILSETIPIAASEANTPVLHQPKITKVASGTEPAKASSKKVIKTKISIENYKKKSKTLSNKSLFVRMRNNAARQEQKKQSLKLTEKECERFNLPRLSLDDDDDDISDDDLLDDDKPLSLDDIYADLAPKSPDDDDFTEDIDIVAPVLIPTDALIPTDVLKTAVNTSKTDVDMRNLPVAPKPVPLPVPPPVGFSNILPLILNADTLKSPSVLESDKQFPDGNRKTLIDPRLRRDVNQSTSNSPNPYGASQFPNIPPLLGMNPVYTPSYAPSMTPIRTPNARAFEMTPTHQSFEIEQQQKHVYAPTFSMTEKRGDFMGAKDAPFWETNKMTNLNDNDQRSIKDGRATRWEPPRDSLHQNDSQPNYNPRHDKFHYDRRDGYNNDGPPTSPFGWADGSNTPVSSFGRRETPMTPSYTFSRSDGSTTPSHNFGRSDGSATPSHTYGRSDGSATPSHIFGRTDGSSTPSHIFGRPDGSSTPSQIFGRSECPPTPTHSFGRSECPPTPSHPFGRPDMKDPRLNRRQSDYDSRIYHDQDERDRRYQNDRSYNRSNSYKSHGRNYSGSDSPRNHDRDQSIGRNDRYSNDQDRYSKSSVSDRHFEKEQGYGRHDKNYTNERGFGKDRREPNSNRSLQRDDGNRFFTKNRDSRNDVRYYDNREDFDSHREQREKSIGKVVPVESNRSSRDSSISRTEFRNSHLVKPLASRSFTIDTSVNATFQKFLEKGKGMQVCDYTFDARRKRASSVGRSLGRESNDECSPARENKPRESKSTDSKCLQRRRNFQRASSVGRALVADKNDRSFKEIKADFESYRLSFSKNIEKITNKKDSTNKKPETSASSSRSRRTEFDTQNTKQQYSPRKNNRDPRMRKDHKDFKNKNDRGNSLDRRHSGIVYSNDNLAKGTIMGTGFGVKNYKIPKIKRPEPERPKSPIENIVKESDKVDKVKTSAPKPDIGKNTKSNATKDKNKNTEGEVSEKNITHSGKKTLVESLNDKKEKGNNSDDSLKSKNKLTKLKDKNTNISDVNSEKRVTRSSRKSDSLNIEQPVKKTKRIKQVFVDSDSDDENETEKIKMLHKNNKEPETKPEISEDSIKTKQIDEQQKLHVKCKTSTAEKEQRKTLEEDSLDSSFAIDDLEIFSDNIVSDPVIDNINDLIADLDHDLGGAKSGNDSFTTEMENIMGDIDNQEENTLGDISELIEKDLNESNEKLKTDLTHKDENVLNEIELVTGPQNTGNLIVDTDKEPDLIDVASKKTQPQKPSTNIESPTNPKVTSDETINDTNKTVKSASNDEIVSTTHIEQCKSNSTVAIQDTSSDDKTERFISSNDQSTPDSTIIQNDNEPSKSEESLPDSTMDIHSEVSSDVTSTHDIQNDPEKCLKETADPTASLKEISAMESFGNILSILQDKSKIKELLLMLGDQTGESEKIKKKLEKLSEIVSDDEDTNDERNVHKSDDQTNNQKTSESLDKPKDTENIIESVKQSSSVEINKTVEINTETRKEELTKDRLHDRPTDSQPKSNEDGNVPYLEKEKNTNKTVEPTDLISQTNDSQELHEHTFDDNNDELESLNQDEINDEKIAPKKTKVARRGKGRGRRGRGNPKSVGKTNEVKVKEPKAKIQKKKRNRELQTLQNDIKEMFMRDEVLNATGIRMCRLAKMVDKKGENVSPSKEGGLLQKSESTETLDEPVKKIRKKPGPKPKSKLETNLPSDQSIGSETKANKPKSYKPGPKSRIKQKAEAMDPYDFETDSVADTSTTKDSDINSSDSDSESIASSGSLGSSEVLADIKKKPKKKRGGWQTGIIKPKHRKKKNIDTSIDRSEGTNRLLPVKHVQIPDMNCFTDKMYCFQRGIFSYDCRLCHYSGTEIVNHYKKQHAHTEVPLSRMDPNTARKAIRQCEEINFQAISKIPSEKYTCRFCYKEFSRTRVALETFFWHVVSTHTGEFKHLCYECVNITRCPFNLDIPPPPKEIKGQLIGYICGKCNFTQISLENLKTHVIVRHNDEQTEVYTINLGAMSQKAMKAMLRKSFAKDEKPRTLRSSRSNQSGVEASDDRSEITESDHKSAISSTIPKIERPDPHMDRAFAEMKHSIKPGPMKSKLRFENDDQERSDETSVKQETEHEADYLNETPQLDEDGTAPIDEIHNETCELNQTTDNSTVHLDETINESSLLDTNMELDRTTNPKLNTKSDVPKPRETTDIFEQPHFKLNYKETGAKEYVCCVQGAENHYKTTLLISLKKHVQTKHSEKWDGYCCVCKVNVTLQGVKSSFKDCLTHFLDKHMDDFPVMEKIVENTNEDSRSSLRSSIDASTIERTESPRTYIVVRPLSDLMSKDVDDVDLPLCDDTEAAFPIIENVVSLGEQTVEVPQASSVYPSTSTEVISTPIKLLKYEEIQAEVMSKKHKIVLDTMMPKEMLVRVYKCAGRYCSFTSDSPEDALVHASAHKQLGGEGALECAYCNFDAAGNAIDIVMHVFKEHGRCQFSCTRCFYRAAADQLVGAHFMKAHGPIGTTKVLRSTSILPPGVADTANMLPRETAVPFYICNHGNGACKFRTYTPGKFCEHIQQKHSSEESHPCNLCDVTMPTPNDLVKHMKSHDVKLYQCTWCVHGANTESEMLSHAASMHPTKNPQAYLRIITNKDGSSDLRVLPLIYLNKLKAPVEDVIPSISKENPTREAERSIELEKLIKNTNLMLETDSCNATTNSITEVTETPAEVITESADLTDVETVEAIEKSVLTSPEKQPQAQKELVNPAIKHEPEEIPTPNQRTDIVYCLDSDEDEATTVQPSVTKVESAKQTVIDLSDDEPPEKIYQSNPSFKQVDTVPSSNNTAKETTKSEKPQFKKVVLELLFKCPSCNQQCKNVGGFKRHTNTCCLEMTTMRCPHSPCPIVLTNITQLVNHYNKDHNAANISKHYYCGICKSRWSNLNLTKKHLKDAHNILKVVITSKIGDNGICAFTVDKEIRPVTRELPKRKTSVEALKKYGIDDIDKLPINPIMDNPVYCNICEFSTKVRLNMVRHLQLHAERQPVPQTAPVNPVPHLETNEKHFDKMVNLASSSAATRFDKTLPFAPETASRYPKYVPDRKRHTCGAKGCSYISVDEGMLRCHWQTLHSEAVDYHCVHCPPHQHLDTTKILTASRIIAHLKMHDVNLYACSACSYYHYKKQLVEKHIGDAHKEKGGQVLVVREEGINMVPVSQPPGPLGTMDLKPWQCGLCSFKNMLRQSVVEHCSKQHQTKMQYKCSYCPFRTSAIENIVKHQSNAHPTKEEDVFYYYYREGTVPNEPDGTTRWQKQRQKSGLQDTPYKAELEPDTALVQALPKTLPIDLNLVKKEVEEDDTTQSSEMSDEDLCKLYGQFCEPNGISFKCSLCNTVSEYTRDAMQSHLYEELKYRRWSCAICPYKAYHKAGLNDHMASEHSRNFIEPSELPVNINIEKWVSKLLDHQAVIIEKNKVSSRMQAAEKTTPVAGPSKIVEQPKPVQVSSYSELEEAFGFFGAPKDDQYCCPKCNIYFEGEDEMRNHLESELTKIRWCCTKCTDKFSTFHEAQFHCKSHPGLLSRPKEAIRDPSLRSAWISAVITTQKTNMNPISISTNQVKDSIDLSDASDNSLLVVRYEEAAPTEEQLREIARQEQIRETRKRPALSDSDDEDSLVIHEPENKKINVRNCPFCEFVSKSNHQYKLCMREHILRHYNLKVLTCFYCSFNGSRKTMYRHLQSEHPGMLHQWKQTEIPNVLPSEYNIKLKLSKEKKNEKKPEDELPRKICLHCEAAVLYDDMITHLHGNRPTEFGEKGEVVVKCCICLTLRRNLESMQVHYKETHPDITKMNYAFFKLKVDTREVQACGICQRRFTFLRDLRIHHSAMHGTFNLTYNTVPYRPEDDDLEARGKRKLEDPIPPAKRIAKKSTAKLPNSFLAKKSTTKLPFSVNSDSESDDEFSYYGTKPSSFDKYENVKTRMPMCNTVVEIDVKKLSGILKIDPKVVVNDCEKRDSDSDLIRNQTEQ